MSLRLRLTLANVALVAVSLILFALLSYLALDRLGLREVDDTLQQRAESVLDSLHVRPEAGVVIAPAEKFATPDTYVQVLGPSGSVVSRSDNLGARSLPIDPTLVADNMAGRTGYITTLVDGGRMRIYSVPSTLAVGGRPLVIVQVGRLLTELDRTLANLRLIYALGTALTLVVATLLSAGIISRGLRPIAEITAVVERIERAEDVSQRVVYEGPMDEVGRLAATFNAMLGRLERAFKAQQRFVADASHSLRTPLTAIQGNVELLLNGIHDPAEQRISLQAIRQETGRLSRVVSDLLLLAQADAGQSFQHAPVEMMTIVLDVYPQARTLADGVTVSLGHEDIGLVAGDPDRLKEVVLNLTDNAIKYTPAGGQVTLSVYEDKDWVRVEIADTGQGIPPEHLPHIFERFYRVPGVKARAGRPAGTGLGLPIAQWIIESHGGRLTVASEVGRGTTFTIWLPRLKME